jgi:predicted PurR-regulated permease PerM
MSYTPQKTNAANLVLIGLTVAVLYLCYLLFRPFAEPVLVAAVVAIVFYPLHRYMRRFVRADRHTLVSLAAYCRKTGDFVK